MLRTVRRLHCKKTCIYINVLTYKVPAWDKRVPDETPGHVQGSNRIDQADNVNNMTCVNSPSSPTGIARGGKSPSRILPTEGGRSRAFGPQPRSESAGGADRSPEGDPPRRRGQTRESGDAGGRAPPSRKPGVVAAESGKHPRQPDEGRPDFTSVSCVTTLLCEMSVS